MPKVHSPAALSAAYAAARKNIDRIPTVLIHPGHTLFRSIDPTKPYTLLRKPAAGGHVSKLQANQLLAPADGSLELYNRFSGPSGHAQIPCIGGVYFVLQQQALVNESMHYSGKRGPLALAGRCVLRTRLMSPMLVADLSPHNGGALRFLRELGTSTWTRMVDSDDCSVARGIALAVAETGLKGIAVQTVRMSERSLGERGDNLVLFGRTGEQIRGMYIEQATYFDQTGTAESFHVAFP